MINKLKDLEKLVAKIGDENLKDEIANIFFEVLIYYGEDKLKKELINLEITAAEGRANNIGNRA